MFNNIFFYLDVISISKSQYNGYIQEIDLSNTQIDDSALIGIATSFSMNSL